MPARAPRLEILIALLMWGPRVRAAEPIWVPPVEVRATAPAEDERDPAGFATVLEAGAVPEQIASLADLLETSAGTHVRRAGRAETLVLRGAGAHQVSVFLDEVPLTGSRGEAFDFSSLPVSYVDRVEVLRGAAAATYGSGAQGGVVHVRTRRIRPGRALDTTLRLGSWGRRALDAAIAQGGQGADTLVVGSFSQGQDDFPYQDVNGATRRRQNGDHHRVNGLARGRWRLGSSASLTLLAEAFGEDRGEPGPEQFERPAARSGHRRRLLAASWRDEGLAAGRLAALVVAYRTDRGFRFADPSPVQAGQATSASREDLSSGARARLAWVGSAWHQPAISLEGRHEQIRSKTNSVFTQPIDAARSSGAVVLSEALYLLGERLSLLGVLRLDDTTDRGALWVPKGGAALEPLPWLTLRGNVGRAFRDPSFDELYFEGLGIFGDPELRPEDGWGWDAGLQLRSRWASAELATFAQRYDRLILFTPVNAFQIRARDDLGARVRGLELSLGTRAGPLRLDANYTRLDTEVDAAPRAPLPYRPADRARGRLALEGAGGAVAYLAVDGRSEVTVDRFGHRTLDGYSLWSIGLAGVPAPGLRVGLEVRNLLDRRDAVDALQQPLPGRTVLLEARYQAAESGREETR